MGRARWPWAYVLATALAATVWYLTRADTLWLHRGAADALRVTGGAFPATTAFALTLVVMGVVPAILAQPLLGRGPTTLGLGLGDTRWLVRLLAIGVPIAVAAGYVGSVSPDVAAVYPLGGALTAEPAAFAAHAGF